MVETVIRFPKRAEVGKTENKEKIPNINALSDPTGGGEGLYQSFRFHLVSRNDFMTGNADEGNKGLRRNSGVEDQLFEVYRDEIYYYNNIYIATLYIITKLAITRP